MKRGKAKVLWEAICLPKREGELGIRRLEHFNATLIALHIRSIISLRESLWVRWIHMYKLRNHNFWDYPFRGNMSWGWRKMLQVRPTVQKFIWYKDGNGSNISAWFDNWCTNCPSIDTIFAHDIHRGGFDMQTKLCDLINEGSWLWPNEWSTKYPSLSHISIPAITNDQMDILSWRTSLGVFNSFSVSIAWEDIRPRRTYVAWSNVVWFSHCIPRHAFHMWLVIQRKLKTQDLLRQWDVGPSIDLNLSRCSLCELIPDSHSHLFFECSFSSQVWSRVMLKSGMSHSTFKLDDIMAWLISYGRSRVAQSIIAKLVFAEASYFTWQERNTWLFKHKKRSIEQVVDIIISTVRLKLLTFEFKRTTNVERVLARWKLPKSLLMENTT